MVKDYLKGQIYRLVHSSGQTLYVGSTIEALSMRIAKHRYAANRSPERPLYKWVAENGGWGEIKIILIRTAPCDNQDELRREEREEFDKWAPNLNVLRPYVTREEELERIREKNKRWREQNSELHRELKRQWKENNRDRHNAYKREYYARKAAERLVQQSTSPTPSPPPEPIAKKKIVWKVQPKENVTIQ